MFLLPILFDSLLLSNFFIYIIHVLRFRVVQFIYSPIGSSNHFRFTIGSVVSLLYDNWTVVNNDLFQGISILVTMNCKIVDNMMTIQKDEYLTQLQ